MGVVHGKAGKPVELQAFPEAWSEGTKRKQTPEKPTPPCMKTPVKERVTSLEADDIKIESVEEQKEDETAAEEETTNPEETENKSHSSDKINLVEGRKTPAEVSITSRRPVSKSAASRSKPKSSGSYSLNGSMENQGSSGTGSSAGQLSVTTSYNMVQTVRSGCRTSKVLLDYFDVMFNEMMRKNELMSTNTRMVIKDEITKAAERHEEHITDMSNQIKDLKQTVEKQNRLREIQRINEQRSQHRSSPTNSTDSPKEEEKTPPLKNWSRIWSRAATSVVRRADSQGTPARLADSQCTPARRNDSQGMLAHRVDSQCAPAPTPKPSRIPVAVPNATIRSMFFDRTKSETCGNVRDRHEKRHEQSLGNSSSTLSKRKHRSGSGAIRRYLHDQKRKVPKGKQIHVLEHKKGPKLAQYR